MTEQTTQRGIPVNLVELRKTFGGVTRALDGFSCDLAPGELVVLLGPSGCGKTTALRALAGLEDIDSGRVLVGGNDLTGVSAAKRGMAMVFQAYSLFPHMTAKQNVEFGLAIKHKKQGAKAYEGIAEKNLELVGLADQADKYPHQMSGGQQQRIALARALAVEPSVLLLDEPLSALDAKVRVNLREEIRRIQREAGITTLFVTHDQEEALAVADRVGVMNAGNLEQISKPEELYNEPQTEFVASFIGLTNRVPARAEGGDCAVYGQKIPLLPGSVQGDCTALIRPENITLEAEAAGGASARVTDISFLGALTRVTVKDGDGRAITAQMPAEKALGLRLGGSVSLRFTPVAALTC